MAGSMSTVLENTKGIDVGRDCARELLEHQMLIDHFGREAAGLEQALAIPDQCVDAGLRGGDRRDIDRSHSLRNARSPASTMVS